MNLRLLTLQIKMGSRAVAMPNPARKRNRGNPLNAELLSNWVRNGMVYNQDPDALELNHKLMDIDPSLPVLVFK